MKYDYSKLKGKIIEVCGNNTEFAKRMKLSERTISLKLSNQVPFKQTDIEQAVKVLGLKSTDIEKYFFTKKVH